MSGMSVGSVIGAAVAPAITGRWGSARGLLVASACTAPCGLLIPFAAPGARLAFVVLGGLAIGIGVAGGNVIKSSWRQAYCPRHLLGRVTVSMQFLNYGTIPVGALLAGALGTILGLRPTISIMVVALVLATLVLALGPIRHHRDLPVAP